MKVLLLTFYPYFSSAHGTVVYPLRGKKLAYNLLL
jgi:hypothetical protein